MKRLIFILCLLLPLITFAKDEDDFQTIFGGGELKIRGFGGPLMAFTSIGDNFAHMMGGGGGIIINNFFFGGYGMGLTTEIPFEGGSSDELLEYGHGGLWFGLIMNQKRAIHPTFHVKTGWGSISKSIQGSYDVSNISSDKIFVVMPTIELEANISRFMKIGAGGSYTFMHGADKYYAYSNSAFKKPAVYLSFKFGWFN